jgi:hypothetical protein
LRSIGSRVSSSPTAASRSDVRGHARTEMGGHEGREGLFERFLIVGMSDG